MMVDTDVLVDALRGRADADAKLASVAPFEISVIAYMELLQGIRNKDELRALRASLTHWHSKIAYLSEAICAKAVLLMERHQLSHALGLQDALIAATALDRNETLMTGNEKHYRMVAGLSLERYTRR
jgi:hypothetical protein